MLNKLPAELAEECGVCNPRYVTETNLATIWKVDCRGGNPAALKIYHGADMRNESAGVDLLAVWAGNGAAHLYRRGAAWVLLEWLDGPSLGDLTRSGDDKTANNHLVDVANRLHHQKVGVPDGAPNLADWFGDLFLLEIDPGCEAAADIGSARNLAEHLLDTQRDVVWLHGDLHHDNIRRGARGYCAFDAKGVAGEKCYELANAFRNPWGAAELVRNPQRIEFLADLWSRSFDVDRHRLLKWAAAKCALSIAWRSDGVLVQDSELDLLSTLIKIASRID